jgi:hypothetical protein
VVPPLHERDEDLVEVDALSRQPVLVARRALAERSRRRIPGHERVQPVAEDVAGDADVAAVVLEAAHAEEGLAQDVHRQRSPMTSSVRPWSTRRAGSP